MLELRLSKKEFEDLLPIKLQKVIHTESDLYHIKEENRLLKIYDKLDDVYLNEKKKNILNLIKFNNEEKIEELIIPDGLVYVEDRFIGEILPKIDGDTSTIHLYNKGVILKEKIDTLKGIGRILEKIRNSNPKFNACFSDVHSDNFMVSNGKVYAVDTSSMQILDSKGIVNFYLYQLSTMNVDKYKKDYTGIIEPSTDTDIYCYIMMILKFLSGSDLYILSIDKYNEYLEKLNRNGFDSNLINSFKSIYENTNNINPLPYLDDLYDLDEKKLSIARKIF